jgi:uncharacterized damage-inducible protein DinB
MTKDDIELLFEYDRWANRKVFDAASALTQAQFTRNLGGGFSSIRDTLLHIVAGEWIWLQYWKAESLNMRFVSELERRRNSIFQPDLFHTPAALRHKWEEVEREQVGFVEATPNESLNRMLPHQTTYVPLVQLMQHVANHSTYHRGQIALMLRQVDAEPIATDFHVFLVERDANKES